MKCVELDARLTPRRFFLVLAVVLAAGGAVKMWRLNFPPSLYFDEIYNAFTAQRYRHHDHAAYDPWAVPPPNVAFDWTHPPLSRLAMAGFIAVFGEVPWAWRLPSVLAGTAAVGVTALLAWRLFGSAMIGLLSAFFLTVEGLFFTQARIAMNDIFFTFFTMLTLVLYARWREQPKAWRWLYFAGVAWGLSACTKWTAAYVPAILILDVATTPPLRVRLATVGGVAHLALAFSLIPAALYALSYAHMFYLGWNWAHFVELQRQMFLYHTGLTNGHEYGSRPWQWILNLRPVWMYGDARQGWVSAIYNVGNPVVLWMGLWVVAWETVALIRKNPFPLKANVFFLISAYFFLWAPWLFSPRVQFFYHYLPAVPILVILLARRLVVAHDETRFGPGLLWSAVFGSALWFAAFYPHLTGVRVSTRINQIYTAFPGWR